MLRKPPRDPKEVGSFAELRQHYSEVWRMLDECKRMKSASDYIAKARTKEVRGAKDEAKHLRRDLKTVTRKQAATDQFRGTAGWSGAAIGVVTVTYTGFETYGFPGPEWLLTHEFVKGGIMWIMTALFAGAAKAYYGAD